MWKAKSKVRSASVEAVIIRADGFREPLGVIARYDRNPLLRFYRWLISLLT